MPEPLHLRFRLSDSEASLFDRRPPTSAELRDFLALADDTVAAIALIEAQRLIDEFDLSPAERLDIKTSLSHSRTTLTVATQLADIGSGSLVIEFLIDPERLVEAVFVIGLWASKKAADSAWAQSPLRRGVDHFFESIFRGARETAEHTMAARRPRSVVEPSEVVERPGPSGAPMLEITILRLPARHPQDWERAAEMVRRLRDQS